MPNNYTNYPVWRSIIRTRRSEPIYNSCVPRWSYREWNLGPFDPTPAMQTVGRQNIRGPDNSYSTFNYLDYASLHVSSFIIVTDIIIFPVRLISFRTTWRRVEEGRRKCNWNSQKPVSAKIVVGLTWDVSNRESWIRFRSHSPRYFSPSKRKINLNFARGNSSKKNIVRKPAYIC